MTNSSNNKPNNPYQPPQSMQDVEIRVEVDSYPTIKVVIGYTVLGTLCGMLISTIYLILVDGFTHIKSIFFIILSVGGIAFLPALFTGLNLASKKFIISHYVDYLKVAFIGQIISTIYLLIIFLISLGITKGIVLCILFGLVGAISAMIVGRLVLPKK